jgi:hypothetical protein
MGLVGGAGGTVRRDVTEMSSGNSPAVRAGLVKFAGKGTVRL